MLTAAKVEAVTRKPPARRTTYRDAPPGVPGLMLRVSPSGAATWSLAYWGQGRTKATYTIGALSEKLGLKAARDEAKDLRERIRKGDDPRAAKRAAAEAAKVVAAKAMEAPEAAVVTFSKACDAFAAEELPRLRPATRAGWARFIKREIKPALGDRRPEDITPDDIADLRGTIADGTKAKDGTWKRKPSPVSARRCYEVVRRIFGWLATSDPEVSRARKRHGLTRLEANPAISAATFRRKRKANGRTRATAAAKAFSDDQLCAIFEAAAHEVETAATEARTWEAEHPEATRQERTESTVLAHEVGARAFANLLDLVAHTGVRAHDARAARWEHIDQGRKVWTIPEHKTSDHTGAPHVVPLSTGALAVLGRVRAANLAAGYGRSEWLFPADTATCEVCERGGHVDKDQKAVKRVKDAAGVQGRGVLHRMRDTIKTRMSENGVSGPVSEAILAHVPPGIVGTYDHAELLPQRREALEWWSGELARILTAGNAASEQGAV